MSRVLSPVFGYASLALAVTALVIVLKFGLLTGFLAACAAYSLAIALPNTALFRRLGSRAPLAATVVVATIPLLVLTFVGLSLNYLGSHLSAASADLMNELGRIIGQWREALPTALAKLLPEGPDNLRPWLAALVKSQLVTLKEFGQSGAHCLLLALVGAVIGLLMANGKRAASTRPLSAALATRAARLQETFSAIVVAQFWIASINTGLTAIFFYAVLPLTGVAMPYAASLLVLTFFAGMLPVVGNLLCNAVTTIVALSVGPFVAVAALTFLVFVHKLEYVINAKVVGTRMSMAAWELLASMFVLEAIFGIPGLVAAPFFYAYAKREMRELGWI